jgi:large subunit ribosomal protein L25
MADERIRLEVRPRDESGSPEARRLRRAGMVPGVLYGAGKPARPFVVSDRELRRVFGGGHTHQIVDVVLEGQKTAHHAVLKDYQLDPVRPRLLHVDFHEVRLDQPIQTAVIVELVGEPAGVVQGGVLSQVTREVNVEALPMAVPETIELDVSGLNIGDSARLADLIAPEGVTLLDDPDTTLASVTPPTRVEEPEEAEEVEEGAEEEAPTPEAEAAGEPDTAEE